MNKSTLSLLDKAADLAAAKGDKDMTYVCMRATEVIKELQDKLHSQGVTASLAEENLRNQLYDLRHPNE